MTVTRQDELNDASIKQLVDHFYGMVIEDDLIGPVFRRAIGPRLEDWGEHLTTMYRFWSSVMQRSGRYKGNPMAAHMKLKDVQPHFFDRWMQLWDQATVDCFELDLAQQFQMRARNISKSLQLAMFYRPEEQGFRATPAA